MMGYVPPPDPRLIGTEYGPWRHPRLGVFPSGDPETPRLNLDRHGMPRDYATYMWVTYKRVVEDDSPQRRAFLHGPVDGDGPPDFGLQVMRR